MTDRPTKTHPVTYFCISVLLLLLCAGIFDLGPEGTTAGILVAGFIAILRAIEYRKDYHD